MKQNAFFFCILMLVSSSGLWAKAQPGKDSSTCIACHQTQGHLWQLSDHAYSMAKANGSNILADFPGASKNKEGVGAQFSKQDGKFLVELSETPGTQYEIKYTFGYRPLQQYLIEAERGKLQVLPFAWDSRHQREGGGHWYYMYPELVPKKDRLHWMQPLQNWNGMCADCHSDGLQRNYSLAENRFASQYKEINVGCLACHDEINTNHHLPNTAAKKSRQGEWLMKENVHTAQWVGRARDTSSMEACFACHSLRTPLTDGFSSNLPFLDQFTPSWLRMPLYHADGQIKEEVFVYGSFLQSKMFQSGVTCLDCHDAHSGEIKKTGNELCLQCHKLSVFNSQKHHGHKKGSAGAQCVNCHMPETRYMGADDRRDHSFTIPRPHLSGSLQIPNACGSCHKDKTALWAANMLQTWHGAQRKASESLKHYWRLSSGQPIQLTELNSILKDESMAPIYRATAISYLPQMGGNLPVALLAPALNSHHSLIRIAAAQAASVIAIEDRLGYLAPLLTDPLRAVRVAAVEQLLGVNIPPDLATAYHEALEELMTASRANSWRGDALNRLANLYIAQGDFEKTEQSYLTAMNVDPYFESSYINLADLYRQFHQVGKAEKLYQLAISNIPDSPMLHYSYGLFLLRQKGLHAALDQLELATNLAPANERIIYTYLLALHSAGKTEQAHKLLNIYLPNFGSNSLLQQLRKTFD